MAKLYWDDKLNGLPATDRRQPLRFGGCKKQRAEMATDSDWQTVWERADAAGMDV